LLDKLLVHIYNIVYQSIDKIGNLCNQKRRPFNAFYVKGAAMKTLKEIKRILSTHKDELEEKYKITELGIFGSFVKAEQKEKSDVDMLVSVKGPLSFLGLVHLENVLKELIKMKVDLVPKEDLRPELKEKILKETIYI